MILASGVSRGIGFSRAAVIKSRNLEFPSTVKVDVKDELDRVDLCIKRVDKDLRDFCDNVLKDNESQITDIMHKYIDIVNNQNLKIDIKSKIMNEETSAEHAIVDIMDGFCRGIRGLEDEYLNEKCEDIEDIKLRLLSKLTGSSFLELYAIGRECIVVAREITPKDIFSLNSQYVKGIVTISAGPTSSVGAVARKLNIPMVTGAGSEGERIKDGEFLLVDGGSGKVIINPGTDELSSYGINIRF